ncbi:MAG: efflux RND transporter permease subunit, partial [Gammaproteobacteria bacterium]
MTNLPGFCIHRPAFTIVISLVMVIIGLIGFINLPVRWIPNINPPIVTIDTLYPGASAHLVEQDVTKVIEDALSGINGIETLSSNSRGGESQITVEFKLGRNMDAAVEDVRTAVERVRGDLPTDVQAPTVLKADPNNNAMMYISFDDKHRDARELSDYLDKFVMPVFETIDGVARASMYGKRVSSMQVRLDPDKMAIANVTVDEVSQLLRDQNASVPSGQIRGRDRFYDVITNSGLNTVDQFNNLIIRDQQNQLIRLKDIGETKVEPEDTDTSFRVNGKAGLVIGIVPQSIANPLEVEQRVQKVLAELKHTLPAGMEAKALYNQADYIRASIRSVYESFFEAVLFVWLVILAFLRNVRATFIPVITIPVCVISTFFLLYVLGFSINTITLMAFVLAIGLVVDDAIVMLENISRHQEEGLSAFAAAIKGSREMVFPVIAMTLTLTAVYAPIAFTPGLLGILFSEFTFTLAGAVIISGIVALTLSPMMCARILKVSNHSATWLTWLQDRYQHMLGFLLQKRKWVLGSLLGVALIGLVTYYFLPSELAPSEDMNEIDVQLSAPRSASYQYTDTYVQQLEAVYATIPDIQSYLTINYDAPHSYHVLLLKPRGERQHTTAELVAMLTEQANMLSGVRASVFTPPPPLIGFAGDDDGDSVG